MSKLFRLNINDLLRGLVVAVLSAVLTFLIKVLQDGLGLDIEFLRQLLLIALTSGFGYLAKNLLTDDVGRLGGKWQIK